MLTSTGNHSRGRGAVGYFTAMTPRGLILDWAEQGALPPGRVEAALKAAGVTPDGADWRRFVGALFLWLGTLLVAAGVIFFFAYNWAAMGRFLKFGLVEGLIVAAVIAAFVLTTNRTAGKAALLLASLTTGALLALIGQTYQTGADPYQLFAWWAVLILPWAAVARLSALWLLFIALLNLTVGLYLQTFPGVLGSMIGSSRAVWALFVLNTLALAVWELAVTRGTEWLQARWAPRLVAVLVGFAATFLGLWAIFESSDVGPLAFPAYLVWLGTMYFYYRHRVRDLFMLAGGALSAIVVVSAFLGDTLLDRAEAGGFLFIGLVVIGMSAAAAWWLKQVASEDGEEA